MNIEVITLQDRINSIDAVLKIIYGQMLCLDFDQPAADKELMRQAFKAADHVSDAIRLLQNEADKLEAKRLEFLAFQKENSVEYEISA